MTGDGGPAVDTRPGRTGPAPRVARVNLRTRRRASTILLLVALSVSVPAGCSDRGGDAQSSVPGAAPGTSATATTTPEPGDLVVVGASDAVGYGADDPEREAWPRLLVGGAMPAGSTLVNLAVPGAQVSDAVARQLPQASDRTREARAAGRRAVVVVWLNVNDLLGGVDPAEYEEGLSQLVTGLRAGGSNRVLVANTPPLDRSPAYLACRQTGSDCPINPRASIPPPEIVQLGVAAYNAAVDGVVRETGAELVDLHAAGLAARAAGTETSSYGPDGFHPSTAGHRAIAGAFATVLRG